MSHPESASIIPTKILVPIDFSPSAHQALDAAAEIAGKTGAALYLLHVIPEYPGYALPDSVSQQSIIDESRRAAEEHFRVSFAALSKRGIKCATHVEAGADIAGSILDAIERERADLVVITTHGHSGWYPQVFGSVAEKLVKLVQCPLFLLRTPKPESSAKVPFGHRMEWW